MNLDRTLGAFIAGVIGIAALTTIFGRRNTPAVINSLGTGFASTISAALGKGVSL